MVKLIKQKKVKKSKIETFFFYFTLLFLIMLVLAGYFLENELKEMEERVIFLELNQKEKP